MGGRGSGNWYRWNTKATTGACRSIDVRAWARDGLLTPGNRFMCSWSRGGERMATIGVEVEPLVAGAGRAWLLVLDYHCQVRGGVWEQVRQTVGLTWTACHYGDKRPWFRCPGLGCGRRVALLYGAGKYFACRHCYRLVYESQREEECLGYRRRAAAIRRRLGGDMDLDALFPSKPKGMHWRTYTRLRAEALAAERAYDAEFLRRLAYLTGVPVYDPLE